MLMSGWGMQRQQFGEQKHWMLVTLAAMLGADWYPRRRFGLSYHFANGGNPTRRAAVLASMQGCVAGGTERSKKSGGAYCGAGLARRINTTEWTAFPDIRFVWWCGGANFTHHQDTNRLIRAWQGAYRHFGVLLDRRRPPCRYCPAATPRLNATI
jgi:biotin/methionine sulfoxide reductase